MHIPSPTDLKRWIDENRDRFNPPYKTNRIVMEADEFIVMMLHGPNTRLDFHYEPGEEFFYQVAGGIELHLKPEGVPRRIVTIREGEIFLCPGHLAHSPRRPTGSWGLVIERRRKPEETEQFLWFCERCDAPVLARTVVQGDFGGQVRKIYEAFNADLALRTCKACGYVFPETPIAERLSFLKPS